MLPNESTAVIRPDQSLIYNKTLSKKDKFNLDEPLARFTWFKVGGPADLFFRPKSEAELCNFLQNLPVNTSVTILGNSSNLLIRDGGVRGVVIRLGHGFSRIQINGSHLIAGAGAAGLNIARKALSAGLSGVEFMAGIPGTAGGGLYMNAGAYGSETKDVFVMARAIDTKGNFHQITNADVSFSYRSTSKSINRNWLITEVEYKLEKASFKKIESKMLEIQKKRKATQPIKMRTGGSTFKNPIGKRAWELIDLAGCRGLTCGGAALAELHCNFMINTGHATAKDFENLGEKVRQLVFSKSQIFLEWEIERIGVNQESKNSSKIG